MVAPEPLLELSSRPQLQRAERRVIVGCRVVGEHGSLIATHFSDKCPNAANRGSAARALPRIAVLKDRSTRAASAFCKHPPLQVRGAEAFVELEHFIRG